MEDKKNFTLFNNLLLTFFLGYICVLWNYPTLVKPAISTPINLNECSGFTVFFAKGLHLVGDREKKSKKTVFRRELKFRLAISILICTQGILFKWFNWILPLACKTPKPQSFNFLDVSKRFYANSSLKNR